MRKVRVSPAGMKEAAPARRGGIEDGELTSIFMVDMNLQTLPYEAFGRLRFLDFFPKTKSYREDRSGGLEAGIGLSCCEGYGPACLFVSPADAFGKTSEIGMDFDNGCPEKEGHSLLERLGIPVHKGMTKRLYQNEFLDAR
jgi:hypothetical protein